MDSQVKSFARLAAAVRRTPGRGEDRLDSANYILTPLLLLAIAGVLGAKQYVFLPIRCWSTKEVDGKQRMEYAENYCWMENTFYHDPGQPIAHEDNPGEGRTIHYYQWVPFILMAQAILFYMPHLIWLMLSTNAGIDVRQLAQQARKVESECSGESRQKGIAFLSECLLTFVRYRSYYRQKSFCSKLVSSAFGKPAFAMYFVFAKIFVKACYVGNCIGQLYLMRSFLGLNITSFGLQIISDIASNRTWQTTNVFPRVTYCRFEIRNVGKPSPYVLQCVLPVNMLNEKFYIAIWFWVVILLTFNIASAGGCLLKMVLSPLRSSAVKQYFSIAEAVQGKLLKRYGLLEDQFAAECANCDGLFLLTVIEKHAGSLVTSEVALKTFQVWRERQMACSAK